MGRMAKKKQFEIPKPVLRQINECSNGGFVLFAFDKKGMPVVHNYFDEPTKALALQQYVSNWILAVEAVNLEVTVDLMKEELEIEERDEDEEGEEGEEGTK